MILLETGNKVLADTVADKIKSYDVVSHVFLIQRSLVTFFFCFLSSQFAVFFVLFCFVVLYIDRTEAKREHIDVRLSEFDDVNYRVVITKENPEAMQVSMQLPCWSDIKDFGGEEALKAYEGLVASSPAAGYDVTLDIDFKHPIANPGQ